MCLLNIAKHKARNLLGVHDMHDWNMQLARWIVTWTIVSNSISVT